MKLFKTLIIFILGLNILIFLTESILCNFNYPSSHLSIYKFDENIGYKYSQGLYCIDIGPKHVKIDVDEDDIIDRYGEGPAEIIILGDGVIAGLEYEPEKRLGHIIGSTSNKTTVNLSVPGYGTVQQLIAFETWLKHHNVPKYLVILHNLTNDYYDNVQNWEGNRVPTVKETNNGYDYILPRNPNYFGRTIRYLFWSSRSYNLLFKAKPVPQIATSIIPKEQRYVYNEKFEKCAENGNSVLRITSKAIKKLALKYNIKIMWLIWRDYEAEYLSELNGDIALQNISKLTGINLNDLIVVNSIEKDFDQKKWRTDWINSFSRHATEEGLEKISIIISNRMKSL